MPQNVQFQIGHTQMLRYQKKINEELKKIRALFVTNTTEGNPTPMLWLGLRIQGLLESYATGSVATGRPSQTGQVEGDDADKKIYSRRPYWGIGLGLTISPRKNITVTQPQKGGQVPTRG